MTDVFLLTSTTEDEVHELDIDMEEVDEWLVENIYDELKDEVEIILAE